MRILPRRMAYRFRDFGLVFSLGLSVAGCAVHEPPSGQGGSAATGNAPPPADPSQWIGRWQGSGPATLTIMPDGKGRYRIDRRSDQGITTHYTGTASGGRLYFQRLGKTLAIRPGHGAETGDPALAQLPDCLLVVPNGGGYCRRAHTADALPLARGAYVEVKTNCSAAGAADTLYFTGKAVVRPGQKACRASLVGQQGMIFHLDDSCAAEQAASGANETISVPDAHHMAVRTRTRPTTLYRYCATALLPPALQADAP